MKLSVNLRKLVDSSGLNIVENIHTQPTKRWTKVVVFKHCNAKLSRYVFDCEDISFFTENWKVWTVHFMQKAVKHCFLDEHNF